MATIGETLLRSGRRRGRVLLGWLLLLLGGGWFAHKVGWLPASTEGASLFWPLLTIAFGVFLLHSRQKRTTPSFPHQQPEVSHD